MDQISRLMGDFGFDSGKGKGRSRAYGSSSGFGAFGSGGSKNMTSTAGKYIFTALVVPYIFSRIVKPLRSQIRMSLARHVKRGLHQSGRKSFRYQVGGKLLRHLDFLTSKEALFAFWFALLVFLKTILPHFKTAMRTLIRRGGR